MFDPSFSSSALVGTDFVRSFGFARRVVTLLDFPKVLPEPYDEREEPYDPYDDEPERDSPKKR